MKARPKKRLKKRNLKMTENNKENVETPEKEEAPKSISRPKLKKIPAISIRLPGATELDDDKWTFTCGFVEPSGKLLTKECTRKIWQEINSEKLFKKFRYEFDVFVDDKDVVTHINAKLKKEFLPPGFNTEDLDDTQTELSEVKFLEVTKDPSDTLRVMRAPSNCSRPTEDEIVESLESNSALKSGDYISGRYRVEEIRERDGVTTFYIDTVFKQ